MVDYGWVRETGGNGKKKEVREGGRERESKRQERGWKGGIMKEGKRRSLLSQ